MIYHFIGVTMSDEAKGMSLHEVCKHAWSDVLRAVQRVAGPLQAEVKETPQQSMITPYRDYWLHVHGEDGGLSGYLGNDLHADNIDEQLAHQVALRLQTLSHREVYFSSARLNYQNQLVSQELVDDLTSETLDDKLRLIN